MSAEYLPLMESEMDEIVEQLIETNTPEQLGQLVETKSFGERTAFYLEGPDKDKKIEVEIAAISPANQERIIGSVVKSLDIIATKAAEETAAAERAANQTNVDETGEHFPGGVTAPEGFKFVDKCDYNTETKRVEFKDLKHRVEWDHIGAGISATLDRTKAGGSEGYVTLRIIHDHSCCAYLFRKDTYDTTHFVVYLGSAAVE